MVSPALLTGLYRSRLWKHLYILQLPSCPSLPSRPNTFSNSCPQVNENVAYILGALTSVGGVTGYVRTGSVPSIAAGLTVGALVSPSEGTLALSIPHPLRQAQND
jgi:hypothetical protein